MPQIENRWTWQGIVTLLGLLATATALYQSSRAEGEWRGEISQRVEALETDARQASIDSRTLIRVEQDVAYIKQAVQNLTRDLQSASSPLPCPPDQPILVASHCRASAGLAFYE